MRQLAVFVVLAASVLLAAAASAANGYTPYSAIEKEAQRAYGNPETWNDRPEQKRPVFYTHGNIAPHTNQVYKRWVRFASDGGATSVEDLGKGWKRIRGGSKTLELVLYWVKDMVPKTVPQPDQIVEELDITPVGIERTVVKGGEAREKPGQYIWNR